MHLITIQINSAYQFGTFLSEDTMKLETSGQIVYD